MLLFPLQTTSLKSGALRHDIHYWLGKDTSQVTIFHVFLVFVNICILLFALAHVTTLLKIG